MKQLLLFLFLALVLQDLSAQTLHSREKDLPCLNGHINLHVHIALDSLQNANFDITALESAVTTCNRYFEPICLSFSICEIDTIYNYNFDSLGLQAELAHITGLHQTAKRLNVYLVEDMWEPGICGFGGGRTIWLRKACPESFTHEMGHVFGLAHTFAGNGTENVDGSNCDTAGDGICDTPADPYNPALTDEIDYQRGCEFIFEGLDANGQYYQPDMGNIMSYYGCDCGFTRGQYLSMAEVYLNSHKNLW